MKIYGNHRGTCLHASFLRMGISKLIVVLASGVAIRTMFEITGQSQGDINVIREFARGAHRSVPRRTTSVSREGD